MITLLLGCLFATAAPAAETVFRFEMSAFAASPVALTLKSAAFANNGEIPKTYTCAGPGISPPLQWSGAPAGTKSFALIEDDPDAPNGTWTHWLLFNIPAATTSIAEGAAPRGAQEGKNGWGRMGYGAPCPPSGRHRYFHKLYALDTTLAGLNAPDENTLLAAMRGHVLGTAELMGTVEKR